MLHTLPPGVMHTPGGGRRTTEHKSFPPERRAAGAHPVLDAAVLLVRPQVRQHREVPHPALAAAHRLGAVAPPVVVLQALHAAQRSEPLVAPVPAAPLHRAAEQPLRLLLRLLPGIPARPCCGIPRRDALVLVAVTSHVHPQVGLPLEALPADEAEVRTLCHDLVHVHIDDVTAEVSGSGGVGRRGAAERGCALS